MTDKANVSNLDQFMIPGEILEDDPRPGDGGRLEGDGGFEGGSGVDPRAGSEPASQSQFAGAGTDPAAAGGGDDSGGGDAGAATDPDGAGGGASGGQGGKGKTRFKSHEEAERGYRELQSVTTKAQMEAAAARRAAEAAARRMDDFLARQEAAQKAEEGRRRAEAARVAKAERIQTVYEDAGARIDTLDPSDPEYNKQVARIWADAYQRAGEPDPDGHSEGPDGTAPGDGDGGDSASQTLRTPDADAGRTDHPSEPGPSDDGDDSEASPAAIKKYVAKYMGEKAEDIDPDNDPVFIYYASRAPMADESGRAMKLDEQIDWALGQTRQYLDGRKKTALQKQAAPMSRGAAEAGSRGGAREGPARKVTIADAIGHAADARRI